MRQIQRFKHIIYKYFRFWKRVSSSRWFILSSFLFTRDMTRSLTRARRARIVKIELLEYFLNKIIVDSTQPITFHLPLSLIKVCPKKGKYKYHEYMAYGVFLTMDGCTGEDNFNMVYPLTGWGVGHNGGTVTVTVTYNIVFFSVFVPGIEHWQFLTLF